MKKVTVTYGNKHSERKVFELAADNNNELEVTDGYHTFSELYEHRYALFCALVKGVYDSYKTPLGSSITCWKSKLHSDGTMFDNSFIVQMVVRKMDGTKEQISYHLPLSWWDKFTCMSIDKAWEWDGHDSKDVIKRLLEL